jgi:hypothetical protein
MTAPNSTGWFVHQGPGTAGAPFQPWNQGPNYFDNTLGSFDLSYGIPFICVEGASSSKYIGLLSLTAESACGQAGNVYANTEWQGGDLAGLYMITLYPGHATCGGDSGSYIRRPNGAGGSWNAGTFSGHSGQGLGLGFNCFMSQNGAWNIGYLTTFWKAHLYVKDQTGRQIWAKTW